MIVFKTKADLDKYTEKFSSRFTPGEVVTVEDTTYYWDNEWKELKIEMKDNNGLTMTMYELNEQLMSQMPDHTSFSLAEDVAIIDGFHTRVKSDYYMMLCKEASYFTIFTTINPDGEFHTLGDAAIACAQDLGSIRAVTNIEDSEIEIWVNAGESMLCLHLFNYAAGVVPFGA